MTSDQATSRMQSYRWRTGKSLYYQRKCHVQRKIKLRKLKFSQRCWWRF